MQKSAYLERPLAAGYESMLLWVLEANPACGFYERLGGRRVRTRPESLGGLVLPTIAHGWTDLAPLRYLSDGSRGLLESKT